MLTAALLSSFEVSSSFHWTYRSLGQLASFDRRVKSEKLAPYNSTYALKKNGYFACRYVCLCTTQVPGVLRGQKRTLDPWN